MAATRLSIAGGWSESALRTWGWPGLLGLLFLLGAGGIVFLWLPAVRQQIQQTSVAADAAELRAVRLARQRDTAPPAVPAPQRFREGFPSAQSRQDRIAALLARLVAHGLAHKRSDYQLVPEAGLGLWRYRMAMPVSGPYREVREFIEEALAQDPALGLDSLRLRRASANAADVEADLGWSFYMQAAAATPPRPAAAAASGSR